MAFSFDKLKNMFGTKKELTPQDQFTENLKNGINDQGLASKGLTEGVDNDGSVVQTLSDVKQDKSDFLNRENPYEGREQISANSSKVEKDTSIADAIGKLGEGMSKGAKAPSTPSYGNVNSALGNPVDVMAERRAALMKLMGRV